MQISRNSGPPPNFWAHPASDRDFYRRASLLPPGAFGRLGRALCLLDVEIADSLLGEAEEEFLRNIPLARMGSGKFSFPEPIREYYGKVVRDKISESESRADGIMEYVLVVTVPYRSEMHRERWLSGEPSLERKEDRDGFFLKLKEFTDHYDDNTSEDLKSETDYLSAVAVALVEYAEKKNVEVAEPKKKRQQ